MFLETMSCTTLVDAMDRSFEFHAKLVTRNPRELLVGAAASDAV